MDLSSFPSEIILEIIDYLPIENFLLLKFLSKKMLELTEDFQNKKSKNFISNLKRNLKIEYLLKEKLEKYKFFTIENLLVHEHKLLIDSEIACFDSPEIMVHLHFSFYNKKRFHEIKIFEDFSDEATGSGSDFIFISYGTPGFKNIKRNLTIDFYVFGNLKQSFDDLKKVQKWTGFEEIDVKIFKNFIDDVISISEVDNKNIRDVKTLLESEFCQEIRSQSNIKFHYAETTEKKLGYTKQSLIWLNDWMEEIVPFDDITQEDSKFPDFGRIFRSDGYNPASLNHKIVFDLYESFDVETYHGNLKKGFHSISDNSDDEFGFEMPTSYDSDENED